MPILREIHHAHPDSPVISTIFQHVVNIELPDETDIWNVYIKYVGTDKEKKTWKKQN
jgi:hypothetical protein